MANSDEQSTDLATAASELLATWERLASTHKMVGSSCSCGAHGIVLRLTDFEQDIGDYLRNEGEKYQRRDVVALLQESARDGQQWSIVGLLQNMTRSVDPSHTAAAKFVLERLPRTVQSFEELHRRR